jgi:pilus assembly protein CpaE
MGIPTDRIEMIVNRSDGRNTGRVTVKDLEETIRKPIFACIPNDYQFVARSIDFGRPVAALDRSSPVRQAIHAMAKKILAGGASAGGETQAKGDRRGFLSRFLAK